MNNGDNTHKNEAYDHYYNNIHVQYYSVLQTLSGNIL